MPPRMGYYREKPPSPTVDPGSSSLLEVLKNLSRLVINSSKIEGMWIVSSKGKIAKNFYHKMLWRTNQNPLVISLLLHQIFTPKKKCIKRLDSVKKNYKHLVFKCSFYLWESNNNKFFIIPKLNTCWKSEIWNTLKINDGYYKCAFLTQNGKKQQRFLAVDEGIWWLTVKPIGTLK